MPPPGCSPPTPTPLPDQSRSQALPSRATEKKPEGMGVQGGTVPPAPQRRAVAVAARVQGAADTQCRCGGSCYSIFRGSGEERSSSSLQGSLCPATRSMPLPDLSPNARGAPHGIHQSQSRGGKRDSPACALGCPASGPSRPPRVGAPRSAAGGCPRARACFPLGLQTAPRATEHAQWHPESPAPRAVPGKIPLLQALETAVPEEAGQGLALRGPSKEEGGVQGGDLGERGTGHDPRATPAGSGSCGDTAKA